jgi:hypothetical protein
MYILGAAGVGGVGVNIPDGSISSYIEGCQIVNCETGFSCNGTGTGRITQTIIYSIGIFTMTNGILANNGGTIEATCCRISADPGSAITYGMRIMGHNGVISSSADIGNILFWECATGIDVSNGLSVAVPADLDVKNCEIRTATTCGINVGLNGNVRCLAANIFNSGSADLDLSDATAVFIGNGNRMRIDKVAQTTGSTLTSQTVTDQEGSEGINIRGELQVGYYASPRTFVAGSGPSHTYNMSVLTETPASVFTDRTSDASTLLGTPFPLFDGTAVGNRCYIGLTDTTVSEGPSAIKVINIQTAIVLGTGALIWEYWNGAAWTQMYVLATQAEYSYLPKAQIGAFDAVESQNIRFGNMPSFGTTTVNGILAFWVRVSVSSAITTVPIINQIKLRSNTTKITETGFIEWFGKARPTGTFRWDSNLFHGADLPPTDQDIWVSKDLSAGRVANTFTSGANERVGLNMYLPEDIDTSYPITLLMAVGRSLNVNMQFTIRWGWTDENSLIYGAPGPAPAVGPNEQNTTIAIPPGGGGLPTIGQQINTSATLNVQNMVARRSGTGAFGFERTGDLLWVNINRTDANGGLISIANITVKYKRWCNGGI